MPLSKAPTNAALALLLALAALSTCLAGIILRLTRLPHLPFSFFPLTHAQQASSSSLSVALPAPGRCSLSTHRDQAAAPPAPKSFYRSQAPEPYHQTPSIMSSYLSSFLSSAFGTGAAFDFSDESDGENQSPVNATTEPSSSTTTKAVKPTGGDAESSSCCPRRARHRHASPSSPG